MITIMPDHREVYYQVQGIGPELLFVHAAAADGDAYTGLVDILSVDHRCVTFDRLGYGRSAHLNRTMTVDEQVAAISAVHYDVTTDPVWVFAHSSGGNFALAYALHYPDRVKGLMLMEPALYAIYPLQQKPPEVERLDKVIVPLFVQGQFEKGWAEFTALFGWTAEGPVIAEGPVTADGPVEDNGRVFGHEEPVVLSWCPSEVELNQMTLPVLIMEGDKSPAFMRNICRLLAQQLGNSTLVTLENQDHLAPWTAPQNVAVELTKFITEHQAKMPGQ